MKSKKLIIFGAGEVAQLAHFYFSSDSEYEVVAFVIDSEYIVSEKFCGLPVFPYDLVIKKFPPNEYEFFIALSYSRQNSLRKEKFYKAKALGYRIASYISSYATILGPIKFGENLFILEDNTIQPFVSIGDNVFLWSGNHLGHHSSVGSHTFISSHVVISGGVLIGEQCFIGVNSTIRDHIKVGDRCIVGAGVLLLEDAASDGIYMEKSTDRSRVPSGRLRKI